MVRTQLYIFTQNSIYNYMFRPCILAIVRLYYKFNRQLHNTCVGYPTLTIYLTLRLLMSYIYIYIYIYGAPILDVSRSHTTTQHSR